MQTQVPTVLNPVELAHVLHNEKFVDVPVAIAKFPPIQTVQIAEQPQMFNSLTEERKSQSRCRCQQYKRHGKLWKLNERMVSVPVVLKRQIQYPDTGSCNPKVQKKMFQTSRLQKSVRVPQMQVMDEVAKVPRSMRRQVLMNQEMQTDQKPEKVQISFKVCVDPVKDGQNDISDPQEPGPGAHLVRTSKAGRTKPKCTKTRTSVHEFKAKCKAPRQKRMQSKKRLTVNRRERQPMKRCQKLWRHERERESS